jgi:hypothetical protein
VTRLALVVALASALWGCGSGSGSATPPDAPGSGGQGGGQGGGGQGGGGQGGGGQGGGVDAPARDASDARDTSGPADAPMPDGPPSDLRVERPTEGSPCRAQQDCVGGTFPSLFCADPDSPRPCGIACLERPCSTDDQCRADGGTAVCELSNGTRGPACCLGTRVCMPACSTGGCLPQEACDPNGHCVPRPCQRDGDCPTHFACFPSGTCGRKICSGDGDCPGGFCLFQRCHSQLGMCRGPVP